MRNNASPQDRTVHTSHVDHVLVVWIEPAQRRAHAQLALWMPALATNEEGIVGLLRKLVLAGFVAVRLDPGQHGEWATESRKRSGSGCRPFRRRISGTRAVIDIVLDFAPAVRHARTVLRSSKCLPRRVLGPTSTGIATATPRRSFPRPSD